MVAAFVKPLSGAFAPALPKGESLAEGVEEVEKAIAADPDNWTCNNTTVFTEDGKVTGILRIWVP